MIQSLSISFSWYIIFGAFFSFSSDDNVRKISPEIRKQMVGQLQRGVISDILEQHSNNYNN